MLLCENCGVEMPDLTTQNLIDGCVPELSVCIKAPPKGRWFVDSGINGHMFREAISSAGSAQVLNAIADAKFGVPV